MRFVFSWLAIFFCLVIPVLHGESAPSNSHVQIIPYENLVTHKGGERIEITRPKDTLAHRDFSSTELQPESASRGSSTGVLELLNTTEWRGMWDLAAEDSFLYVAAQFGIMVFDMRIPQQPRLVSRFYFPASVFCHRELIAENGLLYLLTPAQGLQIIDATNPANLQLRGALNWNERCPCYTEPSTQVMEVCDSMVYVASSDNRLHVIDAKQPDYPHVVGYGYAHEAFWVSETQGMTSYLADGVSALYLSSEYSNTPMVTYDVSDPTAPQVAHYYAGPAAGLPSFGGKLQRSGHYLFGYGPRWPTYTGPFHLKVMDITDPFSPQFACSTSFSYISEYTVSGNRLYAAQMSILNTYDITNPCSPQLLSSLDLANIDFGAVRILVEDQGRLYHSDDEYLGTSDLLRSLVQSTDVSNPAIAPTQILFTGHVGELMASSESGATIVAGTRNMKFNNVALDVSIPERPVPGIGFDGGYGWQTGIDQQGSLLYTSSYCGCTFPKDFRAGLSCIDISNPAIPISKWEYDTYLTRHVIFRDLSAASPYIYVAAEDSGLYIYREPSSELEPTLISTLTLPPQARAIAAKGNRAYVVCWGQDQGGGSAYAGSDLVIVDISNPAVPTILGYQGPWGQYNIEISGQQLATTSWQGDHWAVSLYQIDSTGWPILIATYDPPDRLDDVKLLKLHGSHLYVKNDVYLDVVDISNPANLVRVDQYTPNWDFWDVAVRGDIVYMSEYFGMKVFRGPSCCIGTAGNVDGNGGVDLSDLSRLINYLVASGWIACASEADVNQSGIVDLSDLAALIAYLVGEGYQLPTCQ